MSLGGSGGARPNCTPKLYALYNRIDNRIDVCSKNGNRFYVTICNRKIKMEEKGRKDHFEGEDLLFQFEENQSSIIHEKFNSGNIQFSILDYVFEYKKLDYKLENLLITITDTT